MATVLPFRGLRYDPKHVGGLSQVIAPPFDEIGPDLQAELYQRHPANVVRLELNRPEPGDDDRSNGPTRAARFLREWREQGVLMREPAAAFYVVHQEFQAGGSPHLRRGFLARVRLDPAGPTGIHPHERTIPGPKRERLLLARACRANISPVFGLYPRETADPQPLLDAAVAGQPPVEVTDHLGVASRLWPVTDEVVAARVSGLFGPRPIFIADGHHRYETAVAYRDEVAATWRAEHGGAALPADHPANFVLMLLVSLADPGLLVLPTHRLFREPAVASAAELTRLLGSLFTPRTLWRGPAAARSVWPFMDLDGEQGLLGLYTGGDQAWTLARITPAGRARLEALAPDHGPAWRSLGAAILHRLLIDDLLRPAGSPAPPPPTYAHTAEEVEAGLTAGGYGMAALVPPVPLEALRTISEAGDRLPPKSTFFFPKPTTGLVLNPLE